MRGQEFKVRDKKVQKMTRNGLTEKNLTQGTEQRISSRLEEVSLTLKERKRQQPDTAPMCGCKVKKKGKCRTI